MKAFLHLQESCTHADQDTNSANSRSNLEMCHKFDDLKGFTGWANQGGLGGHFFLLKLWLLGVPGPACKRCMRANFILGNGAS